MMESPTRRAERPHDKAGRSRSAEDTHRAVQGGPRSVVNTVRIAERRDERTLARLWHEADEVHAVLLPDYFQVVHESTLESRKHSNVAADPLAAVLVAEQRIDDAGDPQLVGFVAARIVDSPRDPTVVPRRRAQVDAVVVTPECRRRGVGRQLMLAAEDWARQRGAGELVLTVWAGNHAADELYRELGYEPLARVLRRNLSSAKGEVGQRPRRGHRS